MAAAAGMLGPDPTNKGSEMSSTITETRTLEQWIADPSRTTVEFEVAHLWGLHTVRGRFRSFDGVYLVGPAGTEIELTIDAASVDTGNAARDKHLRSADFFDVAEHPRVRFTSTHITGLGNGRVHISGEVQAAGRTVPVVFDGSVRVIDGELEFEANTTLDQRRFGMRQGPFGNVRSPTTVHVKTRLVPRPAEKGAPIATGAGKPRQLQR
jgi:polyisoprenoid-binding protein YceI